MATNKRGWHIPTVNVPRIRFGSGQEHQANPVMTYFLVIIPALMLSFFGLVMGFSAQIRIRRTRVRSLSLCHRL